MSKLSDKEILKSSILTKDTIKFLKDNSKKLDRETIVWLENAHTFDPEDMQMLLDFLNNSKKDEYLICKKYIVKSPTTLRMRFEIEKKTMSDHSNTIADWVKSTEKKLIEIDIKNDEYEGLPNHGPLMPNIKGEKKAMSDDSDGIIDWTEVSIPWLKILFFLVVLFILYIVFFYS